MAIDNTCDNNDATQIIQSLCDEMDVMYQKKLMFHVNKENRK